MTELYEITSGMDDEVIDDLEDILTLEDYDLIGSTTGGLELELGNQILR